MSRTHRTLFASVRSEGGLLPSTLLERLSNGDRTLDGTDPSSYHLEPGERINEATSRAWTRLLPAWRGFREACSKLAEKDAGTSVTRERWLLLLFQELGYGRLQPVRGAIEIEGRSLPISHKWGACPIHLVGLRTELDRRTVGVAGAARSSPHSLVQEYLNKVEESLWGYVSNGLLLRILRDNLSLTRQSFVEFDLEAMMEGEAYSDFVLLWMVTHQSRVEAEKAHECWLEKWSREAADQGTRALDRLRTGVEEAIRALGRGFLSHPANGALREQLRSGALTKEDYYRQILRLVYRLLFLFVAEDRGLLLDPKAATAEQDRYLRFYSTGRLRRLAERRRGSPHVDLYRGLRLVMDKLGDPEGCPSLGLPVLGSFLWSPEAIKGLASSEIANRDLLEAVRALAFAERERRFWPVDYRNLGAEELGSVYESLLELHPDVDTGAGTFELRSAGGSERKTTGSYYTPSSLIACLLDSALDPVLNDAAKADDPERAILDLKICDPACGSGHFLIAAAHRVAKRLAAARTGDEEPSPNATRTALRDVIGHCIYGVDLNPMAVELCKVNLWMEALEPGKPLSFLDHRIQCGNSLLGTTPALMAAGIPDEAFIAIAGDDKEIVSAARRKNRAENTGRQIDMMLPMAAEPRGEYLTLSDSVQNLDRIDDGSIAGIRRKEESYRSLSESAEYRRTRRAADAWCAAFVWLKVKGDLPSVTTDVLRRFETAPNSLPTSIVVQVDRFAQQYGFFHWHLAFAEVHAQGGFDVVVGNPPWERVKLQEEEFFAARAPEIARAKNAAARKKMILLLPETNPSLAAEWSMAVRTAAAESAFFRLSGRYPLGGVGDVNTYAVFADLARQLIKSRGMAALLIPNGLVTGFTYRAFLKQLLDSRTLASFYGLENEDKIFPQVHNETKFGILIMTGGDRPVDRPWFTAHLRQPSQVHDDSRRYSLTARQIENINPNTLNLPTFRWAADADVTAAIHAAAPVLVRRYEDGRVDNPWQVRFRTMFHMANDSADFLDHLDLQDRIVERRGAVAVLNDSTEAYPLYEGKMLWHFDHRYGTYAGQTEKQANKGVLPHVSDELHNDPDYRIQPRYWVAADKTKATLAQDADREWFYAWRDVGPTERTFIGSVVPVTAAGHKAPILISELDARSVAALTGVLSSLLVDYDARQKSNQMTFFVVEQLAVLTPAQLMKEQPWLGGTARDWLTDRVHELAYTNVELAPFARELGNDRSPFRWIPERRALLQAEIDAAVLMLYGLTRAQAEWLIDSFFVLRKYEERDHGEYLTKRLVLEVFDAMMDSQKAGKPYRTDLDPPPAHASCSHPARRS